MSLQLPYGLQKNVLKHISEVERGLDCKCNCPSCGHPLIARKGEKTAHHFAHYETTSCSGATETALHLAAKETLEQAGTIRLPDTDVTFNSFREPFRLCKSCHLTFDEVWLEYPAEEMTPDLLIEKNGRHLAIEIKVSHEVDDQKRGKARNRALSILEIDLSKLNRTLTPKLLQSILVEDLDHKSWIYNHRAQLYHDRLLQAARQKMIQDTGMAMYVQNCPKEYRANGSGYYALVVDDCWHCRHCVHHDRQEDVIYCAASATVLAH